MTKNKIIDDAIELVKNIPSTDEPSLEKFESTEQPKVSTTSEYIVIGSASGEDLIELVNTYMAEDWVTCWGVSVVQTSTWLRFYQAMERWNVNWEEKVWLNIPGLEDEPDLYEDIEKDAIDW